MERTLAHDIVRGRDSEPDRWLYMLHGIYGAGRNWGSVARQLVRDRPDWGVVLVDLREHGGSVGLGPPHTLEAAADDLRDLARTSELPVTGVLGHSFGGKVALEYARRHGAAGLEQLWLVDSTPEAREPGGTAWGMLEILRRLPASFPSRTAGVEALEGEGVATPIAQWLSTNLEATDGEYRWRIDLDAMEALLRDFFQSDLWDVVEDPPGGAELHVVRAEESSVLGEAAAARVEKAGSRTGRVFLHHVAGGHWVNAENPGALLELLETEL